MGAPEGIAKPRIQRARNCRAIGKLSLTDATAEDVVHMSRYIVRPDTHLELLIRRESLDFAGVERRYPSFIRSGDADQVNTIFAIKLNETLIRFNRDRDPTPINRIAQQRRICER